MSSKPRRRGDAGTTVVEFSLIALVIFIIALGGVDFGLWMFQKSEASQAAREASRVAILYPPSVLGAQTSGPIYEAATKEIESNLASSVSVSVTCQTLATPITQITTASSCKPDVDTVTVTVQWHRDPLTFVGFTDTVSGSSTRTVVGVPTS